MEQNNSTDHDLLIRVDTKLGTLVNEMQLMRDNTNKRLDNLEKNKLDKEDFNDFRISNSQLIVDKATVQDKEIANILLVQSSITNKLDSVINKFYIIAGIGICISTALPYLIKAIFKV